MTPPSAFLRRPTIARRLVLSLLATALAPTLALTWLAHRRESRLMEENVRRTLVERLSLIDQIFRSDFSNPLRRDITLLRNSGLLSQYLLASREEKVIIGYQIERLFIDLMRFEDRLHSIAFIDAAGTLQVMVENARRVRDRDAVAADPFFRRALAAPLGTEVATPIRREGEHHAFYFAAPVLDPDTGNAGGVIRFEVRLDTLLRTMAQMTFRGTPMVWVLTDEGEPLTRPESQPALDPRPFLAPGAEPFDTVRVIDDGAVAMTTCGLPGQGQPLFTVALAVPDEVLHGEARSATRRQAAAVFIVMLGMVGAGALLASTLARPLVRLTQAAQKIAQGDLSQRVPADSHDEVGLLAAAFNDMTQALQTSTVSKEYVDKVITSMTDALVVLSPDGNVRTVNKALCDLVDQKPEDLIHAPAKKIFGDPAVADRLAGLTAGTVKIAETFLARANGQRIPIALSASVMRDPGGGLQGIVCVAQDITERKRAEEALWRAKEELEHRVLERTRDLEKALKDLHDSQDLAIRSEKMAAIGELAANVGHELRNPLAALKNAVYYVRDALKDAGPKDPLLKDLLEVADREIQNAAGIISDLLDFAAPVKLNRQWAQAEAVLTDAVRLAEAPPGIDVRMEIPSGFPFLRLDPWRVRQVFVNLTKNALQAMPKGGVLTVRGRLEGPAGTGWAVIDFEDTGGGIEPENLKKLFQPLFTTKAKGAGFGLAISQTVVHAHGGRIDVKSVPGQGTTFSVRFVHEPAPTSLAH